jgi:hypothetical protein
MPVRLRSVLPRRWRRARGLAQLGGDRINRGARRAPDWFCSTRPRLRQRLPAGRAQGWPTGNCRRSPRVHKRPDHRAELHAGAARRRRVRPEGRDSPALASRRVHDPVLGELVAVRYRIPDSSKGAPCTPRTRRSSPPPDRGPTATFSPQRPEHLHRQRPLLTLFSAARRSGNGTIPAFIRHVRARGRCAQHITYRNPRDCFSG